VNLDPIRLSEALRVQADRCLDALKASDNRTVMESNHIAALVLNGLAAAVSNALLDGLKSEVERLTCLRSASEATPANSSTSEESPSSN
jgi:hypothetical protein